MPDRLASFRVLSLCAALASLLGCGPGVPDEYQPRAGDVVFQALPRSPLVDAIEGASGSPFSHCGIVTSLGGEFVVLEALRDVHFTRLASWIERGRQGAFSVYRLRAEHRGRIPEILAAAEQRLGLPYDVHYAMDDEAIYCSELIFKAFRDVTGEPLGQTTTLGELDWRPFESTIMRTEGGPVPVDREMITPRALADAEQLQVVLSHGWPRDSAP